MSYSKIPAGKDLPNDIYVAIEIPANHAPIKYEIDKDTDCLFANLGRPLSREYLYERFWPHEEVLSSRPLDTHIYRLRNKLGLTAERGWQLLTIYGYGYRLESVATVD